MHRAARALAKFRLKYGPIALTAHCAGHAYSGAPAPRRCVRCSISVPAGTSAVDPPLTRQIINTYNAHVNTGNFTGAAALTFDENVRYIIPGTQPQCPYCTTYEGKAAVISLFVDGFLGHFTILNPLVNLREITTDTGGPGGVPELMDFNGATRNSITMC